VSYSDLHPGHFRLLFSYLGQQIERRSQGGLKLRKEDVTEYRARACHPFCTCALQRPSSLLPQSCIMDHGSSLLPQSCIMDHGSWIILLAAHLPAYCIASPRLRRLLHAVCISDIYPWTPLRNGPDGLGSCAQVNRSSSLPRSDAHAP
jgi:hypothetical protein